MFDHWLLWTVIVALNAVALPYFLFLLAISIAALLPRRKVELPGECVSKFLIVIPAHDEETVIAKAVQSCLDVNYPRAWFEVLVIADNCSDQTALQARAAGARVVERFDDVKKSKGYALNDLFDQLESSGELSSWNALVIVDADTMV